MANRRTLKRNINLICEELFAECVAVSLYSTKTNKENVEALLHTIVKLCNESICRVSNPEPGMSPKVYFKDVTEKFDISVNEIIDQINNLH